MMKLATVALTVAVLATASFAGSITFNNASGSDANQWIHSPFSTGGTADYVSGSDTMVSFYEDTVGGNLLGTGDIGTGGNVGWLSGSISAGSPGDSFSVVGVVTYTADAGNSPYGFVGAGSFYTLATSPSFSFSTGGEIYDYESGGSPIDGSGWTLVPEPGTWALFGIGLVTLVGFQRRRRK